MPKMTWKGATRTYFRYQAGNYEPIFASSSTRETAGEDRKEGTNDDQQIALRT
jgi:hypothetical protein